MSKWLHRLLGTGTEADVHATTIFRSRIRYLGGHVNIETTSIWYVIPKDRGQVLWKWCVHRKARFGS
jgi:hypothetical protein